MSPAESWEWLDGKMLVAWLREIGEAVAWEGLRRGAIHHAGNVDVTLGPALARRWREWKNGARANVWIVDALLTRHGNGITIHDIPNEIWREYRRDTGRRLSHVERAQILMAARGGEATKAIARRFDVSPDTIRYHRRRAGLDRHGVPVPGEPAREAEGVLA